MSTAHKARMLARDAPKSSRNVFIVIMFESTSPDMRGGGPCVRPSFHSYFRLVLSDLGSPLAGRRKIQTAVEC